MDSSFQNISTAQDLLGFAGEITFYEFQEDFAFFLIINYVILETEKEAKDAIL